MTDNKNRQNAVAAAFSSWAAATLIANVGASVGLREIKSRMDGTASAVASMAVIGVTVAALYGDWKLRNRVLGKYKLGNGEHQLAVSDCFGDGWLRDGIGLTMAALVIAFVCFGVVPSVAFSKFGLESSYAGAGWGWSIPASVVWTAAFVLDMFFRMRNVAAGVAQKC